MEKFTVEWHYNGFNSLLAISVYHAFSLNTLEKYFLNYKDLLCKYNYNIKEINPLSLWLFAVQSPPPVSEQYVK